MTSREGLEAATNAWREFCSALEKTGIEALARMSPPHHEIDLAEGLRHLTRLTRLALESSLENRDGSHPYLWTALDPHRKMGGDNPQGLYLTAPLNGSDTYRLKGNRGSARWVSIILAQDGPPPFGNALFLPDIEFDGNGDFEVVIAPEPPTEGTWLQSDDRSNGVLIRQFFGAPDDVVPMTLELVDVAAEAGVPPVLDLQAAIAGVARAGLVFSALIPMMQDEMLAKANALNTFETDIGDPTSNAGGVPGGNAVTARWALGDGEALVITVTPPKPCAYWDVQVGNIWYESFDYRHVFSGFTCESAYLTEAGALTFVVSETDPGTANWLQTAGHREGHVAIRWQLSEGDLPIPDAVIVPVDEVAARTGLPAVDATTRSVNRALLAESFDRRFGFSGRTRSC